MAIRIERSDMVATIVMDRPEARNAVDGPAARALIEAFEEFERDEALRVAVLWGAGGTFCAGADLKARGTGNGLTLSPEGPGPMGPTRMAFTKPTIAAVEGHAVAGGLELSLMCDLRVAGDTAIFGVFCRRWGVPLARRRHGAPAPAHRPLPRPRHDPDRAPGGRPEALGFGLANRVVPAGRARDEAEALARDIAAFPPHCVRSDRRSAWESAGLPLPDAMANEFRLGKATHDTGESQAGARRFATGAGRHGQF